MTTHYYTIDDEGCEDKAKVELDYDGPPGWVAEGCAKDCGGHDWMHPAVIVALYRNPHDTVPYARYRVFIEWDPVFFATEVEDEEQQP